MDVLVRKVTAGGRMLSLHSFFDHLCARLTGQCFVVPHGTELVPSARSRVLGGCGKRIGHESSTLSNAVGAVAGTEAGARCALCAAGAGK